MTANARHLKLTGSWGTPPEIVDRARAALGGCIELDPMSSPEFNEIVGADRILTEADDCFSRPWICSTALVNPHGGLVVEAWRKLMLEYQSGRTGRAIWVGFSVEQLCILADEPFSPPDFSMLICRKRIPFLRPDGRPARSPSHGNYICGVGVHIDDFRAEFDGMGKIFNGSGIPDLDHHGFGGFGAA